MLGPGSLLLLLSCEKFLSSITKATAMTSSLSSRLLPNLVLLDRDGVVNEDVGSPGVVCKSQLELTEGAAKAIGRLQRSGCCRVALVTNQSCVGKKLLTQSGLDEIHDLLREMLVQSDKDALLDAIYACTSTKECNDPRMKPNPGMVMEACRDFSPSTTTGELSCVFVGDTLTDLQAAKAGGVPFRILVETGYGLDLMGGNLASVPPKLVTNTNIDDYGNKNKNESNTQLHELRSVTPFIYAKNLEHAVAWLLNKEPLVEKQA